MERRDTDVAIIGAGPGGLSAALWCGELGLSSIVFEAGVEPGGQLLWTHNPIENYLGAKAKNGREMRDIFLKYFAGRDLRIETGRRVSGIDPESLSVRFEGGGSVAARSIVIATGVRRRDPGIEGLARFAGKGLLESGKKESGSVKGKTAVVVGGGDAAFENALILSPVAERVLLVHRGDSFRARPGFISSVRSDPRIEVIKRSEVCAVDGDNRLRLVSVRDRVTNTIQEIPAEALIFRIGVTPNSESFKSLLKTDAAGYISVDSLCRTSVEGVFAVGDVASPTSPTISTAAGMGATCAKFIYSWLIQSSDIQ
jgi:thioredoxin reductase (NADPH)